MLDHRFRIEPHPTYKSKSNLYFGFGWVTLVLIIASGHLFDIHKDHFLHDYLVISCFVFFAVWVVGMFILDKKTICPKCKGKLKKTKWLAGENLYLKCIKCMIAWDTGIEFTND